MMMLALLYAAIAIFAVDGTSNSINNRDDLHSFVTNRKLQDCTAEETAAFEECDDSVEVECGACVAGVAFDGCDGQSTFCEDIWACTIPCGNDSCLKKYIKLFDCTLDSMGEYKECVQDVCLKSTNGSSDGTSTNGSGDGTSGAPSLALVATVAAICGAFLLV